MRRDQLRVIAVEPIGVYRLLRLTRGALEPGVPGQFFMIEAPGRLLPRPFSLCQAPAGELTFLVDPVGVGTRAICDATPGDRLAVLGPLGNGFSLDRAGPEPLLIGGGIGIAPFPYLRERLGRGHPILGFRTPEHAFAASLLPGAEVVVAPTLVTEALPAAPRDVFACGPEPMLQAVAALAPDAQLAWEAPMACGYGACFGCAVEIGGHYRRLCIEGPVLSGRMLPGREAV